jgi:hypothetical protein
VAPLFLYPHRHPKRRSRRANNRTAIFS